MKKVALTNLIFLLFLLSSCSEPVKFIEPNFSFYLLENGKIGEEFDKNKIPSQINYIVMNFFAPDCPPCVEELPEIEKLHSQTLSKRKDVLFLAVGSTLDSVDTQNKPDPKSPVSHNSTVSNQGLQKIVSPVKQFKRKYSLKYPVFLADSNILRSFGVTGFPETLIFKKNKSQLRLMKKFISSVKQNEIEGVLLSKPSLARAAKY